MINPFDAKAIQDKANRNLFFNMEKLSFSSCTYSPQSPLFFTTMAHVCYKENGKHYSPLLTQNEVNDLLKVTSYVSNFNFLFTSTFVVTSLMSPLIILVSNHEILLTLYFVCMGALFYFSMRNWFKFQSLAKEKADLYRNRQHRVVVASQFRKRTVIKNMKLWAGPFAAVVVSEAVDLSGSEELKLIHDGIDLGSEAIKLVKLT
ncbi:hypothetical protein [Vibrio europaeus]|uniref:Uncharacterized protein n=1 Tax=Vibrio europaeus TaxID=300876 RepID=A0A178J9J6_9VIBR|nr:hypothetical protein [Vibrio europaeus]MDC5704756.1 hypothetical protein [Vibrio europaeus]MDC5710035.1 hypothetical protein [Vibrio europaeus]MDC5715125.1 hypothetical protein [Vibrio europaeus]MDC5719021.1 hypothetical protein [Vibrio europaeus]MDC5724826.1 hypothetical protein [Vibrio europaeus]